MATNRRRVQHERRQRVSQEALSAFLSKDEDRLRSALGLDVSMYTPLHEDHAHFGIDPNFRRRITPNNDRYMEAVRLYDIIEAAARQYRDENGIAEPVKAKPAAKRVTKRRTKA